MGIKYILAVFLAAAFFMTGCSSKADNSGRYFDDNGLNNGVNGRSAEGTLDNNDMYGSTTADGYDSTYGTGLNGEGTMYGTDTYDLTGMDYTDPNLTGVNGVGALSGANGVVNGANNDGTHNGMASTTNTGTNF